MLPIVGSSFALHRRSSSRAGRALLAAALVTCAASAARAQDPPHWRVFTSLDGLPESWIGDVTRGAGGRVYITHGDVPTMSIYDGFRFTQMPNPGRNLTVREAPDGRLWTLLPSPAHEGIFIGLQAFDGTKWAPIPLPGVRPFVQGRRDFLPWAPGRVLLTTPDRLLEFDFGTGRTREIATADGIGAGALLASIPATGGGAWVAAARGLLRVAPDGRVTMTARVPEGGPAATLCPSLAEGPDGTVIVVLEHSGAPAPEAQRAFALLGSALVPLDTTLARGDRLLHAWPDVDGRWWTATGRASTFDLALHAAGTVRTLPRTRVTSGRWSGATPDPGGGMWIGTALGLLHHLPAAWRPPEGFADAETFTGAFLQTLRGQFIAVQAASIAVSDDGRAWRSYPVPAGTEPSVYVPGSAVELPDGRLVFGTSRGVRAFEPSTGAFTLEPFPAGAVSASVIGAVRGGGAWIVANPDGASAWLEAMGSTRRLPRVQGGPRWSQGMPRDIFETAAGDLFFVPDGQGIGRVRNGIVGHLDASTGYPGSGALCGAEVAPGRVWFGDRNSVVELDGSRWRVVRSGLQTVRRILLARDGAVWVASGTGLHRYRDGSWMTISTEDGLPDGAAVAVTEDRAGGLWVTTTAGLRRYHPDADPDAPDTWVVAGPSTSEVPPGGAAYLAFGGADKWALTLPGRLLFSSRLDGGPWSPFTSDGTMSIPGLADGAHVVDVRAMDRNGNVDQTPATFRFEVLRPWYREAGFLLLGIPGLLLAGAAVGLMITRYLRLERLVEERTRALQQANIQIQRDAEARQRAEAQLHQAQKLEAIGRLAGGVAHDFNNLLTVISGYADLLLSALDDNPHLRTAVKEIENAAGRATALTRQLLAFGRHQVTRPEPLDLNAVVGNILRMLGRLIGEDVTIAFEPTPGLWPVMADRGEIEQVLMNLAVNARDAMPDGGCLAIDVTNVEVDGASPRLREGGRPGPHVRLGVSDTGSGMDPDTAQRLFEPFFTTKPAGKGTGLGLSVVYGIVAGSGGWIAVTSESGKGTRFEVYLPRCADTARAAGGGERAGAPTRGGAESILLVEDDPPLRAIGVLTLTRQGYAVLEAASAEDAQACLVAADGRVDLVVTDILMTGQNGLQLAEWIRGRWPSIRVLFMSGYAGDAVAKHGLRDGDVAFLQKPFTPDSLTRKVRETLDA